MPVRAARGRARVAGVVAHVATGVATPVGRRSRGCGHTRGHAWDMFFSRFAHVRRVPAPKRPSRKSSRVKSEPQPNFPIAYVKYHDHCWLEAKELAKIEVAQPYVVEETGFLLVENEKYVTLAKERSTDGEKGKVQYDDVTIIMKSDILAFVNLGVPGQ